MTRTVVNAHRVAPGLFGDFDRLDCTEAVRAVASSGTFGSGGDDSAEDVDDEDARGVEGCSATLTSGAFAFFAAPCVAADGPAAPDIGPHVLGDDFSHVAGSPVLRDVHEGDHFAGSLGLSFGSHIAAALTAQYCVVDVLQHSRRPESLWPRFDQSTPASGSFRRYARLLKRVMSTDIGADLGPSTISVVFSMGDIESERFSDADLAKLLNPSGKPTYGPTSNESVPGVAGREGQTIWIAGSSENDDVSAKLDSDELGAPSTTVLTRAVDDLRAWLSMTQQDVAQFVGISAQTVMSWRREEPRFPRHRRIPVLLGLWAAASGARDVLDAGSFAQMVWGAEGHQAANDNHSRRVGVVPVGSVEGLTDRFLDATIRCIGAGTAVDDGYVPGVSTMPSRTELAHGAPEGGGRRGRDHNEGDAPRG